MKRYLRLDIEYDYEEGRGTTWLMMDNLKRVIQEDMPYVKVVFSRDTPTKEGLDEKVWIRE